MVALYREGIALLLPLFSLPLRLVLFVSACRPSSAYGWVVKREREERRKDEKEEEEEDSRFVNIHYVCAGKGEEGRHAKDKERREIDTTGCDEHRYERIYSFMSV